MGWYMDTDRWFSTNPRKYPPVPPGNWGGGTQLAKIAPGLLAYATTPWNDPGGIQKSAFPNTTVATQTKADIPANLAWSRMWDTYVTEINSGHPVEVSFFDWLNAANPPDDTWTIKNQPVDVYFNNWAHAEEFGHSVVGVGYYDPDPNNFNFDEYFICQDNWSTTSRYVAVPVGPNAANSEWEQNDFVWPEPQGNIWAGCDTVLPTDWGTNTNWINWKNLNPLVPNGAGVHVIFGNQPSKNNSTVDLSVNQTVDSITFNPTTSTTIQSINGSTLTLHNVDNFNNVINATVTVAGTHTISANIQLNSNADITVTGPDDVLSISGNIADGILIPPNGITKYGSGLLQLFGANSYTGPTDVEGGILEVNTIDNALANSSIGAAGVNPANLILGTGTTLRYTGGVNASTDRGLTMGDNVTIDTAQDLAFNGTALFSAASAAIVTPGAGTVSLGGQVTNNVHFYKQGSGTLKYNAAAGVNSTIATGNSDLSYVIQNGSVIVEGVDNTRQYNVQNGELTVGDTTANAVNLTVNSGTVNVGTWLSIGRGNGTTGLASTLVMNGGIITCQNISMGFNAGVVGFNAAPSLTLKNGAALTSSSFCYLGESSGSNATITLQDNSQFNISDWLCLGLNGSGTMIVKNTAKLTQSGGSCDFNIGDSGTGNLTIQDTATVSAGVLYLGRRQNSNGVISQSGGTVDFNKTYSLTNYIGGAEPTSPGEENPTHAWGAYNLSGGSSTLSFANSLHVGNYGYGAFNQTGGANSAGGWCEIGNHSGSLGVYSISGGSFSVTDSRYGLTVGNAGVGTLNISGTGTVDSAGDLYIAPNNAASIGIIDLNGGTLATKGVSNSTGTNLGTAIINLNGGEHKAKTDATRNADFLRNVNGVYVWNGDAVINTDGNDVTINQVLAAPTGKGLQSIALNNGGAGYMGTPVVNITSNGAGKGATAVADVANGAVTGITITNPGTDYAAGDLITVQLFGGGYTAAANIGAVALNGGNNSTGGLTKKGLGKLTLTATNTYIGKTIVSQGTLEINKDVAVGAAPAVLVPDQLTLAGGTTLVLNGSFGSWDANRGITLAGTATIDMVAGSIARIYAPITGPGGLIKTGSKNLSLASRTYSGDTTIMDGMLSVRANDTLPFGPGKGNMYVQNPGELDIYNFNVNINGLYGDGYAINSGSNIKTLTLGNNNANGDFSGTIGTNQPSQSKITPAKVGAGTQILRGMCYYSGATYIDGGTLQIDTGAALTLHAISGIGTPGVDNSTDLTVDSINIGTLTIGAGSTVTIAAIPGGPLAEPLPLTPVPEPSAWAMLLLAAMGLGIYRHHAAQSK
jgi:autotransporter-associated beta strand protein/T5SS/PEP-CTERM-associated repeat protein